MKKVEILVACHKQADVFSNDVYVPIHVGKALAGMDLGYMGDDTGDNISNKNKEYCELTAQYWAWKNLKSEYVGLCHYRRYFEKEFKENNVEQLIGNADIVLAKSLYFDTSVAAWHIYYLTEEDVYVFYHLLKKMYPQHKEIIDDVYVRGNKMYPLNMFVTRKELFDEFAEWQFNFFFELEKHLKPSGYSRLKRVIAFFGEIMLALYVEIKGLKVCEMPIVTMIGDKNFTVYQRTIDRWRSQLRFKSQQKQNLWNEALITGMKIDGLYDRLL